MPAQPRRAVTTTDVPDPESALTPAHASAALR